ncbi:hypothetical protein ACUR5C_15385 [Aliikangiella sp. IMCC44653]
MSEIWAAAVTYPTAIFTTINLVLIGFWLLVAFGLFDIEFLSVDLDIDSELQPSVQNIGGFAGLLSTLGLTGVPITIVFTIVSFIAWLLSYIGVYIGLSWNENTFIQIILGSLLLIASFAFALPISAQIIKPMRPLFRQLYGDSGVKNLIGAQCKIRSSRVDENFGEASCDIDGANLIVKVRAEKGQQLATGELVRIIDFDPQQNTYFVVSEKEFNQ